MQEELLAIRGLKKYFPLRRGFFSQEFGWVRAVDGVTFSIYKGETLGLVGESGCGKSTLGRLVLRLIEPTEGEILFEGQDILEYGRKELRNLRRQMQIIFQDPFASLNPRMTVGNIIGEALIIHKLASGNDRRERVNRLLKDVGLTPDAFGRYPHEFSGGQRQRIGIARALAVIPKLIVADEPVSALDVSIQAQIINLLVELQERFALTYLFIAHDLRVVKHICDRVVVMYLGRIVEIADNEEIYASPLHPYTQALLSAIPVTHPRDRKRRAILAGDVPSPIEPIPGCPFNSRCQYLEQICREQPPRLKEVRKGHLIACHVRGSG
ncbi:MAG: dipeptide ABC transporter ATP-binding protein [Deltaproteobacteria bacterium]|nr:MAG: dipeptide ABC transporter ATP-binding protein [Deltaproteobacteria bacterium]